MISGINSNNVNFCARYNQPQRAAYCGPVCDDDCYDEFYVDYDKTADTVKKIKKFFKDCAEITRDKINETKTKYNQTQIDRAVAMKRTADIYKEEKPYLISDSRKNMNMFLNTARDYVELKDIAVHQNPFHSSKSNVKEFHINSGYGDDSYLHYKKTKGYNPYLEGKSKEFYSPEAFTIGASLDENSIEAADVMFDFKHEFAFKNIETLPGKKGIAADNVAIINPSTSNAYLGELFPKIGLPASLENFKIFKNGVIQADNLQLYSLGEDENVAVTRTYSDVVIRPVGENLEKARKNGEFKIEAPLCIERSHKGDKSRTDIFYVNLEEDWSNGDYPIERADSALIFKKGKVADVCLNYVDDGFKQRCDDLKTIKLR